MNKFLLTVSVFAFSCLAQAQMVPDNTGPYTYSYSQDRSDKGYHPSYYGTNGAYVGSGSSGVAAPASPQAYGFYQQPSSSDNRNDTSTRSNTMMWYPTKQQMAQANGQIYSNPVSNSQTEQPDVYRSPVYSSKAAHAKKNKYFDFHLGAVATKGWDESLDTPFGGVWGISLGTRVSPNVRVDAEFSYHMKAKLAQVGQAKLDYKQYNLGGNIYYDFPVQSHIPVKPFVGIGVWGTKAKAIASNGGNKLASVDDGIKFALSAAAGVLYPINDMFSISGMVRYRLLLEDNNLYNLEGVLGLRYHF